ncbi:hypothetical protein J4Q44_G00049720 [Coregonus suidteri]|uniref:Beta/gamma crystallin 'Greek key' domain-containing protein n=1 Tax=Coregonus suidteri TaxID=861788 RepID=A0AAN8MK63_9TELE
MAKIIFYEDRNFQGRSYETSSDCPELTSYLSKCNSCKVESGCFMVYDRSNFQGNQYFVRRGEYDDHQRMGMTDSVRSCRMIPMHKGQFRMQVYERENFGGQMHELMDDCESVQERLPYVRLPVLQSDGRPLAHVRAAPLQRQAGVREAWRVQEPQRDGKQLREQIQLHETYHGFLRGSASLMSEIHIVLTFKINIV